MDIWELLNFDGEDACIEEDNIENLVDQVLSHAEHEDVEDGNRMTALFSCLPSRNSLIL